MGVLDCKLRKEVKIRTIDVEVLPDTLFAPPDPLPTLFHPATCSRIPTCADEHGPWYPLASPWALSAGD